MRRSQYEKERTEKRRDEANADHTIKTIIKCIKISLSSSLSHVWGELIKNRIFDKVIFIYSVLIRNLFISISCFYFSSEPLASLSFTRIFCFWSFVLHGISWICKWNNFKLKLKLGQCDVNTMKILFCMSEIMPA